MAWSQENDVIAKPDAGALQLSRRSLLKGAGGVLMLSGTPALLAACGGSSGGDSRLFRIGSVTEVDSLNPFVAQNNVSQVAIQYMYPRLVGIDQDLRIVPDYAKSWRFSDGGKLLTLELESGGSWSDGRPLTAEDAAWTITTILKYADGPTALIAGSLAGVSSARARSATTLELRFKEPLAPALTNLSNVPILPRHAWREVAVGKGDKLGSFATRPPIVCGGPFVVRSTAAKQATILRRHDGFYGGEPTVKGFGIQFYGTSDALLEALRQGEIDGVIVIPANHALKSLDTSSIEIYEHSGLNFSYVAFNSNPRKPRHRELLDPQVRLALQHAIDVKRVINDVYSGKGSPGGSVIPPASPEWHDTSIQPAAFDLDKANALLDELGFTRGSDGVRRADGSPMEYEFLRAQAEPARLAEVVKQGWEQVGVRVKVRPLDANALFAALTSPDNKYLDYDIAQWSWTVPPDPDFLLSAFTTGAYGGANDSAFSDPEYDRLYDEQRAEIDVAKRKRIVDRMQAILAERRPYLVVAYLDGLGAVRSNWDGFSAGPSGPIPLLWKQPLIGAELA